MFPILTKSQRINIDNNKKELSNLFRDFSKLDWQASVQIHCGVAAIVFQRTCLEKIIQQTQSYTF